MRSDLPAGIVTFLFTDIEGSTRLLHELGAERFAEALTTHRRLLRDAFTRNGGVEVDTQGDAFFYAFPTAAGAVSAAWEGQEALRSGPIRVRMGVHTGTPHLGEEGYIGEDVHQGARIAAAGYGGQVLLSKETRLAVAMDVTDLGEHRLKDFAEPVWIYQLGSKRFPPLKTISNTNLPRPASSFVGRERETEEVVGLVRDARLVTLTGPGGSGKTRLAIEAAAELVPEHRNGVLWVGLSALRDPALVAETIATTLGSKGDLAEHIGQREMLLLLDNFEQVVEAAIALVPIIEACPNLRILVTSRERLRLRGEVEYRVPPLARREAVDLFCARAHTPPDDTIADLCRRLDDLPLAVELAAARTSVLMPAQIRDRLSKRLDLLTGTRDSDARQATLRATIKWSYDLLSDEEKRLFARLAVFAGGSTLDAAEDVAGANLDTLQSLVDKSLVRHTDGRFSMLETIREYAVERLEDAGESEELRRRHAEHFLALAEEGEQYVREYSGEWLDRLEREFDNIRAAMDRLEEAGETQLVLRLAGALADLWGIKGHIAEGRRRLEGALGKDDRPTAARAKAAIFAADVAVGSGDAAAAIRWAQDSLAIYRGLGEPFGIADALLMLGSALSRHGRYADARGSFEESVQRFAALGQEYYVLQARMFLAGTYMDLGDHARSRALNEENLERARATGNKHIEAQSLDTLAFLAVADGRAAEAIHMVLDAFRLHRELGDVFRMAQTGSRLAGAVAATGRLTLAGRLLSWSTELRRDIGATSHPVLSAMNEQTMDIVRAGLNENAFVEAWEAGKKLTADDAVAMTLDALRSAGSETQDSTTT